MHHTMPPAAELRAMHVGRDPEDARSLFVLFSRELSDADIDVVRERLQAPFGAELDDTPAGPQPFAPIDAYREEATAKNYAAEAAIKCGEPGFWKFLEERHGLERPLNADRAAQKLRSLLGVTSRRELNSNIVAIDRWKVLRREFDGWRREWR